MIGAIILPTVSIALVASDLSAPQNADDYWQIASAITQIIGFLIIPTIGIGLRRRFGW